MNSIKYLALVIAYVFVSIPVSANEELFQTLDDVNQAFAQAILRGDIDHLVNDYTDDACVIAPSTPKACGKEAIRGFWTAVVDSPPKTVVIKTHAVGSSEKLAHATGTLEVTGRDNSKQLSRYVLVLKMVGGLWKLHLDTWTPA